MRLSTLHVSGGSSANCDTLKDFDSPSTLVLLFGASEFQNKPEFVKDVVANFPKSHVIGCSTSGEIFHDSLFDDSLAISAVQFDKTTVKSATVDVTDATSSFAAGEKLANMLHGDNLRGVFILSDGLHVNGSELVRGANSVLTESVIITGGLAGDGDRFSSTWVLKDGQPSTKVVSAVGFYGNDVRIGHGSKGGWDIFGPERIVTKSKDNVLYELDGKPALELYKQYLGERAAELPASALLFPLAIRSDSNDKDQLVRTILSIDEEAQTMTFAGNIPEGSLAQLMRANFDRLIAGAEDAAQMIQDKNQDTNGPCLSIAISCVGRRLVLGERAEEELESTLAVLPKQTKQVGFYSYGEISPYVSGGKCNLHNQTMTLTTISEA